LRGHDHTDGLQAGQCNHFTRFTQARLRAPRSLISSARIDAPLALPTALLSCPQLRQPNLESA